MGQPTITTKLEQDVEPDLILGTARAIEQDARKWVYHLGNHQGGVTVDEFRNAVSLIRDLAQTVAELATRVGDPQMRRP